MLCFPVIMYMLRCSYKYEILTEGKTHSLNYKFLCMILKLVLERVDHALPVSIWHDELEIFFGVEFNKVQSVNHGRF